MWPGAGAQAMIEFPPTMTTYYAKNLAMHHHALREHQPTPLLPSELQNLRNLRLIDRTRNRSEYAGVRDVAYWLGFNPSEVEAIAGVYPCAETVLLHRTMGPSPAELDGTSPIPPELFEDCGVSKFCDKCTDTLSILGRCWHRLASESVLYSILQPDVMTHVTSNGLQSSLHNDMYLHATTHECTHSCPLVDRLSDFEVRQKRTNQFRPPHLR